MPEISFNTEEGEFGGDLSTIIGWMKLKYDMNISHDTAVYAAVRRMAKQIRQQPEYKGDK